MEDLTIHTEISNTDNSISIGCLLDTRTLKPYKDTAWLMFNGEVFCDSSNYLKKIFKALWLRKNKKVKRLLEDNVVNHEELLQILTKYYQYINKKDENKN